MYGSYLGYIHLDEAVAQAQVQVVIDQMCGECPALTGHVNLQEATLRITNEPPTTRTLAIPDTWTLEANKGDIRALASAHFMEHECNTAVLKTVLLCSKTLGQVLVTLVDHTVSSLLSCRFHQPT